jgi:DNA-binding GntR family transcriptional regulator
MPVPDHPETVGRQSLRDSAYLALCNAIVDGTLAPGEKLNDDELCSWLGLSRTPVRGALSQLADEGLVETAPQRYTRVRPLDARRAHDLFPVLAVLHGLATELAVPRLQQADLKALNTANDDYVRALRRADADESYAADARFHDVFVRASGNAHVVHEVQRLAPQLRFLEHHANEQLPGRRSVAQHQAIVARAGAGDAPGAASAARANWLTLGGLVDRALAEV